MNINHVNIKDIRQRWLTVLFGFDSTRNSVKTEVTAGITTFLTMAYILAVNPAIFSQLSAQGMDSAASFTATALAAIIGTLIMAIYARKPFALAPGMGLNAFFVYTVCMGMGYSWQFALTAILIEGFLFIILTLCGLRSLIVNAIPSSLKNAIGVGIGLFIAFIGLRNAGIIVGSEATTITLGDITTGSALLGVIGILVTSLFVVKNIKGALLIGIIVTAAIGIPMGLTHFDSLISTPPSVAPIAMHFEWHNIFTLDMLIIVCTFLFIDIFDTIGTIVGVSVKAGMVSKDGTVPGLNKAFMADAIATVAGACLGTNTTTTYVESASGIAEGGRTGLTAFTVAVCFALALFFAPLFLGIPAAATAPVLVIVGLFMSSSISKIDFEHYREAIPAFITMIMMPLTYSIADGIMLGIITYTALNFGKREDLRGDIARIILSLIFIAKFIFI